MRLCIWSMHLTLIFDGLVNFGTFAKIYVEKDTARADYSAYDGKRIFCVQPKNERSD